VVCACEPPVDEGAVVLEEFAGVCRLDVSGAFWLAGAVVDGVWVCASFGDCANAAVAKAKPTAVVKRRRVFIWNLLLNVGWE
jgi:hypothetical protein